MKHEGKARIRAFLLAFSALTGAAAVGFGAPAQAQEQQTYQFNVPAQPLGRAISKVADQAGLQVLYNDGGPGNVAAPAIVGRMTADEALARLLSGSGYTFQYVRAGVITLRAVSPEGNGDGELVTGAVQVEGAQGSAYFGGAGKAAGVNGINGSRDITATEGTGSFTSGALTIGSKVPQALKDVPQSISVLTSERLKQQNVTDFTAAMRQLPGVTLTQGSSSLQNDFFSRGFRVNSIQLDGGAPLVNGGGYFPQIDMAVYDHVELLRGAAGLLNGYGDPSGTVNLVRKKPLDHGQVMVEAQLASWSNYRLVADATSPLALDGALRGRVVMTYQDNRHFYDTAKDNKTLIYGIAELDVTPSTLLTAGINYIRQDSVPWSQGLPRYLDGNDLMLPRSTCLCFGWNRWDFDTTEIFGGLEQKLGKEWMLKLNLTRNRQTSTRKFGYSMGAVNPTNGLGPQLNGIVQDFSSKQLSAEATLSGAFTLFGERQEVTIGANHVDSDGGGQLSYAALISGTSSAPYQPYPGGPLYYSGSPNGAKPPIDVFGFDPADPLFTAPRDPLPSIRSSERGQVQSGVYVNLRLTAFDRLHLTTGLRWSSYEFKQADEYLCRTMTGPCASKAIGDVYDGSAQKYSDHDLSWPPPVNLSFDITKTLTIYAGYADIYQSQAYVVDASNNHLPPITGSNWEGGFKWAARDGRLNLSLAAYRIRQKNFAIDAPDSPFLEVSPGVYCCSVVDPNQVYESKGIDFEATGELRDGWQISASYTYNHNQYKGVSYIPDGTPLVTIAPKHLYKLWTSYDFGTAGSAGMLSGLAISVGVNGQSSAYNAGSTCVNLAGTPDPITGTQSCASYSAPDYVDYRFAVPPYALLSARIDYHLSDTWSLALNLDNILDKTYYQTTGSVDSGNWYGTPRSFTATLRAKW